MNPMTMGRTAIIEALRPHTTKEKLDQLVTRSTAGLRGQLAYYLSSKQDKDDVRDGGTRTRRGALVILGHVH